jgi:hypothetical protein
MTAESHPDIIIRLFSELANLQEQRALWESHSSKETPDMFICVAETPSLARRAIVLDVSPDLFAEQKVTIPLSQLDPSRLMDDHRVIHAVGFAPVGKPIEIQATLSHITLYRLGLPLSEADSLFRRDVRNTTLVLTRREFDRGRENEIGIVSFADSAMVLAMLLHERYGWNVIPSL